MERCDKLDNKQIGPNFLVVTRYILSTKAENKVLEKYLIFNKLIPSDHPKYLMNPFQQICLLTNNNNFITMALYTIKFFFKTIQMVNIIVM